MNDSASNEFIAVADCARKSDRFVLMVSRNIQELVLGSGADRLVSTIDIVHLDQWVGLSYHEIVGECARTLGHYKLSNNTDLLMDGTGVGDAVVELMIAAGLNPLPIVVTGGQSVREVYQTFGSIVPPSGQRLTGFRPMKQINVPKSELVASAQVVMQQKRVRLASGLKWTDELKRQLIHLSPKATTAGRTRYESDDIGINDDMAFCLMMTAWWSIRRMKDGVAEPDTAAKTLRDWDPIEFM